MKRGTGLTRRTPLVPSGFLRRPVIRLPRRKAREERALWAQARRDTYARDGGRCQSCGLPITLQDAQIHHRKLRSQGGGHTLDNLVTLDASCHRWWHNHPALGYAAGWLIPAGGDPAATPIEGRWRP